MIVSGLLLAATSTSLLVYANDGAPIISAVNLPASPAIIDGRLRPRLVEQGKPMLPDGGRREETRF